MAKPQKEAAIRKFLQAVSEAAEVASAQPDSEDPYVVVKNPGPGTFRGQLWPGMRKMILPVGGEVSLPMKHVARQLKRGFVFARWAR